MSIMVRVAVETDAVATCDVLRRSIRELCVADHGRDEQVLSAWLANKTPENVRGFGLVQSDGEIQLCYLAPEAQYRGAGKLMLRALEEQAARWGLRGVFLTSSVTAKRFYERNGYVQSGEPKSVYGLRSVYPMSKSIVLTPRRREAPAP